MNFIQSVYYKIKEVLGIGIIDSILDVYPRVYADSQLIAKSKDECNIWYWYNIYSGNPPWFEGCDKDVVYKLPTAKIVCEYLSTYNTAECKLEVAPKNWSKYALDENGSELLDQYGDRKENDISETPICQFVHSVMSNSAFNDNLAKIDEQKEALGDFFIKPYVDKGKTKWDYVPITNFWPISWDNRRFLEGVFQSNVVKDNLVYTHFESHQFEILDWKDGKEKRKGITVEKKLFVRNKDNLDDGFGREVSVKSREANEIGLYDENPIISFDRQDPIFCHMYTGMANNKNIESPLHLSRFANSIDTIKAIDKALNEWQQARIDSRIKAVAPAEWFRRDLYSPDGSPRVQFDSEAKVWQRLNYKDPDSQRIDFFQPEYIVDKYISDVESLFDLLAQQTGVASGTYSFSSGSTGTRTFTRTAEEVQSLNATTFATVRKNQAINAEAFEDLLKSTVFLGLAFNLIDESYAGMTEHDFEYSVQFDDSVKQSHESQINEGRQLYEDGLISHLYFLTEYYNFSKSDAEIEIARINQEKTQSRATVPNMFGNYETTGD